MANKVLAALAPLFNSLLNIDVGHFGHSRRKMEPTPANLRAAARLEAIHKANRERLKAVPMNALASRQVQRALERQNRKQLLSRLKAEAKGPGGAAAIRLPA